MSQIVPISENQRLHPQTKTTKAVSGDFSQTLSQAMEAGKPSNEHSASLGEVQACTYRPIEEPAQETLASRTGSLLDLMDNYAQDLGNPSKSLKDIAPMLNTINERASDLLTQSQSQSLTPQDEPLHKIASEVALTAQMEVIKFQRGDYI